MSVSEKLKTQAKTLRDLEKWIEKISPTEWMRKRGERWLPEDSVLPKLQELEGRLNAINKCIAAERENIELDKQSGYPVDAGRAKLVHKLEGLASSSTEKKGGERMSKVKIFCHCCEGKGTISEKAYPSGKEIQSVCPECNGEKWVWSEKAEKVKQP